VITVAVRKHPVFERDGIHLRVDVPVTFVEATLGATIEVPTLDGAPVKLKVAAGTPSGRVCGSKVAASPRRRAPATCWPPSSWPCPGTSGRREGAPRGFRRGDASGEPRAELLELARSSPWRAESHLRDRDAAELSGMHPQTLRQYDRLGLVSPTRTPGQSRRYSMRDNRAIARDRPVERGGLNLEGIRRILELEDQVTSLTRRVRELEGALADELLNRPGRRVFAAGAEGDVISLRAGTRVKKSNQLVVWRPFRSDGDSR